MTVSPMPQQAALNIATPKKSFISQLFSLKPPVSKAVKTSIAQKRPFEFDLPKLNMALVALSCGLICYLGFSIISSVGLLKKDVTVSLNISGLAQKSFAPLVSPLKESGYYVDKAQKRDLFSKGARKESAEQKNSGPSQVIIDATKDLRLVGISWSDDPDVMIEDVKNQMTFFLKKGQLVANDVFVKDVLKDKVILGYKEEEVSLQ